MNWVMQDAKDKLSQVIQRAQSEGPQTITRRGQRVAVVLSAEEYDRLASPKPSFVEHLLSGPEWDDDFIQEINRRNKKPGRRRPRASTARVT